MGRESDLLVAASSRAAAVQAAYGKPLDQLLRELHHDQGLSAREIGEQFSVKAGRRISLQAVHNWLTRLGMTKSQYARERAAAVESAS